MLRVRAFSLLLCLMVLAVPFASVASAANWEPTAGDWPGYHGAASRTGFSANAGAFPTTASDVRVKWTRSSDMPFWVPPVVGDIAKDGHPKVVAVKGNVVVNPGPPPSLSFSDGWELLNGIDGKLICQYGPNTGNLMFYGPTLGDVDGDGKADIVFMDGTPLTGTFSTNKLYAYNDACQKKWEYSDSNWGTKVPLLISGPTVADVDGEAGRNEAVFNVLLTTITTQVNGNELDIAGSAPEERVVALNGEGSPTQSWQLPVLPHGSFSTPAFADMNGDGKTDVVVESGVQKGKLFDLGGAVVTVSDEFEDHNITAWAGGASPQKLWSFDTSPTNPGDFSSHPIVTDMNGDGKPDVVAALFPRIGNEGNITVIGNDGKQMWKRYVSAPSLTPLGVHDLNGDGTPDVVLQTQGGTEGNRVEAFNGLNGNLLWRSAAFSSYFAGLPDVADLNGDGNPEVVAVVAATSSTPTKLVALNGQTGAVQWSKDVDSDNTLGPAIIADLDGDDHGRPEILVNIGSFSNAPALKHSLLVAYEPELPDLQVTNLAFSASTHAVGQAETISAKVTNIGSRQASNAVVRFLDGSSVISEQTVTLAPGASTTLSTAWTPDLGGPQTITASADPADGIAEWSEVNNDQSQLVNVRSADFAFASGDPTFSDANPGAGDTITVGATLSNIGGKDASDVLVHFVDDGTVFAQLTVASLPAGSSAALAANLTVQGERNHVVKVVADPANAVPEENELNNEASRLLNVRFLAPDLTLGSGDLKLSDPNPDEAQVLTVTATVHNQGSDGKTASGVLVRLLDDGSAVAEGTIASIPSGGAASVQLSYAVSRVGPHDLGVLVDPANTITELDELNNAAGTGIVVGKVLASVTMGKDLYGFQEQASGVAHLQFRHSGTPLANRELTIPVDYVVRPVTLGDSGLPQLLDAVGALVAKARATSDQVLSVCVLGGTCVNATVDQALDQAQELGGGAGVGPNGVEFRFRLFDIQATTNSRGDAAFDVPFSLASGFNALAGSTAAGVCVSGIDAVNDELQQLGQAPVNCLTQVAGVPGLPSVANIPGLYRATARVDWYGFVFAGSHEYQHL